jgi:ATP-binding cassette subfamily B protein
MLFFVHIKLAILLMLWLVVLLPVCFVSKKKLANLSAFATHKKQEITGVINDAIANISTIFAFASKNKEQNLLAKHNAEFIFAERKRLKFLFINHIFIGFVYCLMSISVLYLLIKLRQQQLVSNGELAMVFSLIYFTIDATWQLLNAFDSLLTAVGDFKESFLVLQNQETSFDKNTAQKLVI